MKRKLALLSLVIVIFTTNSYGRFRIWHWHCYNENHESKEIYNKENLEIRISIEEKMLKIEKEMIKDNPDWDEIEKINAEIEKENSKLRVLIMKKQHEEIKKSVEK